MELRRFRMTTRRWMTAVAGVAILTASFLHACEWWRLKRRYDDASRNYARSAERYDEGLLAFWDMIDVSQHLTDAELDLAPRLPQQVTAITAHLRRISQVIDQERQDYRTMACTKTLLRDVGAFEESLENAEHRWKNWMSANQTTEAMNQCSARLLRLRNLE
jgi:hypothetical protein